MARKMANTGSRGFNILSICSIHTGEAKSKRLSYLFTLQGGVGTWSTINGRKKFVHPFCADYSLAEHRQMYQSYVHQQATELYALWEELLSGKYKFEMSFKGTIVISLIRKY
jgi:hypothetical protein